MSLGLQSARAGGSNSFDLAVPLCWQEPVEPSELAIHLRAADVVRLGEKGRKALGLRASKSTGSAKKNQLDIFPLYSNSVDFNTNKQRGRSRFVLPHSFKHIIQWSMHRYSMTVIDLLLNSRKDNIWWLIITIFTLHTWCILNSTGGSIGLSNETYFVYGTGASEKPPTSIFQICK